MSEQPLEQPLSQRAARGAIFTVVSQGAGLLVQLTSVVVLARLLSPHDYGLVAIVLVVVAFGETFRDLGLSSASVQAKILTKRQRDNLFWINGGIGLVLALLVFFASGLIAAVTKSPDVTQVAQVLSLTFLVNGLTTQYRASLLRSLRFRALMIVDISAGVLALTLAILAAVAGFGYWALVVQQLGLVTFGMLGVVIAARWIPGLPNREGDIRGFLRFGWNLVGSQLIAYLSSNIDTLTVAFRFGTVSLGFYNRAFQLVMTPVNQIRGPMTTVALPVLARIQDARERFNEYVLVGQLALSYPLCLALGAVAVLADPLVLVALGPQWGPSGPILRLLATSAMFQTLAYVGYWVYVSRGLGKSLFRFSMVSAAIRIACILIGSQWGVIGVAFGFMIGPAINWPISLGWLSRVTEVPTRRLYLGAFRVLGLVAVSATAAWVVLLFLTDLSMVARLVIGLASYLLVVALALLVPRYREDAATLLSIAKIMRGPKRLARDPLAHEQL
ncbi:MAG TPA: lipopolysaccharide biosynthesis protein [Pseudolysinimonas sp.]|nr:lipopolysaccharide biosynthesis protein [Pseudolysinimonas sp.]